MSEILPGLYLGSLHDSNDSAQLEKNKIKNILSVYEGAKKGRFKVIKRPI
jgi:hypothetical protein